MALIRKLFSKQQQVHVKAKHPRTSVSIVFYNTLITLSSTLPLVCSARAPQKPRRIFMDLYKQYHCLKRKRRFLFQLTVLGSVGDTLLFLLFTTLYGSTGGTITPFSALPLYYGLIIAALGFVICFVALIPAEILWLLANRNSAFYTDPCTQAVGSERCRSLSHRLSCICTIIIVLTVCSTADIAILAFMYSNNSLV